MKPLPPEVPPQALPGAPVPPGQGGGPALAAATPAEPAAAPRTLAPQAVTTRRLDLGAGVLAASILAAFEMGPAIAKKAFDASDLEIALITSGHSAGLLLTFFTAHLASRYAPLSLVFWPELLGRLALAAMFFLQPGFALAFVVLHALAQMLQAMTIPARLTVYRANYPVHVRGRIVGRNRQVQLFVTTAMALLLSATLDWSVGNAFLVEVLGPAPVGPVRMINVALPAIAALGLIGSFLFRAIPSAAYAAGAPFPTLRTTARRFLEVWRTDAGFRRYESFFLVFGFANIMSIPLTQIHAVDVLGADYLDMALINVVLVQGTMAATLAFWGRCVDRYPPTTLRGLLNLIFAIDFLAFALAPSLGWIFLGRVFRGVALGGGTLVWMLGSLYYARNAEDAPIYLGIHTFLTGVRWALAPFAGVAAKALAGDDARPVFFLSFVVVTATGIWMLRTSERAGQR